MAENNTSKNQQFLQQFERQRLNKLCNRVIDLRGKVAGECQAYSFGGKTHYLDDRAYLLAKQLLDRFKGRYTFGVYESLLKALKSLPKSTPSLEKKEDNLLLHCDKNHVQMLAFDSQLQRKEPRIIFASPIEIRIADILYNGTTMDITTSAIGVSLKLTSTLNRGDEISVSFLELATKKHHALLANIHYTILKISHDERRTQLILIRKRNENVLLSQWLDEWSQRHNSAEYLNLDTELFNLATHYYLRLYCSNLNSALFWLGSSNTDAEPIKAFHLNPAAETCFPALLDNRHNLDFSIIPFARIIQDKEDLLLLIMPQGSCFIAPRHNRHSVSQLLNWHAQYPGDILLIQAKEQTISPDIFEQELSHISTIDADYAQQLDRRLNTISQLITVTNITASCQYFDSSSNDAEPEKSENIKQTYIPLSTVFRHHIQRKDQRFLIRTKVKLHLPTNKKPLEIITIDASHQGLLFSLPSDIQLELDTKIKVDFSRWQSQTTAVNLQGLSYIVRNKYSRSGQSYYGLERDTFKCPQSINNFFSSTIDRNQEKLNKTNTDVFISQETKIFSARFGENLSTIPFYLGMDSNNQRLLQAVVASRQNQVNDQSLWRAMQQHIIAMSNQLNSINASTQRSISFGLYCYQDPSNNWKIQADYDFTSPSQKSLFINLALRHDQIHFYHCSLMPITTSSIEQEGDLNQTLLQLRPHSPHKVKQIREILHGLFAVGELVDITDIIQASYRN